MISKQFLASWVLGCAAHSAPNSSRVLQWTLRLGLAQALRDQRKKKGCPSKEQNKSLSGIYRKSKKYHERRCSPRIPVMVV
ncbi:hypothetical protein BJX62DRAFT_140934 [Aspergillus germanicus]